MMLLTKNTTYKVQFEQLGQWFDFMRVFETLEEAREYMNEPMAPLEEAHQRIVKITTKLEVIEEKRVMIPCE